MPLSNSFTSNSKRRPKTSRVLGATLCVLILFDVLLGQVFAYPGNPQEKAPNSIQRLLEFGRSSSGKFQKWTQQAAPHWRMYKGSWVGDLNLIHKGPIDAPQVAFFGNSFIERVSDHFHEMNPQTGLTICSGWSAPPSQALGCYRRSRKQINADVVVMGLLASTWPLAQSFSNAAVSFTDPQTQTYPIYKLDPKGQLLEEVPLVQTWNDLGRVFDDKNYYYQWLDQLSQHDKRYDPLLYDYTWLDYSVLARLARRGYASWKTHQIRESYVGKASLPTELWSALIEDFAKSARSDGKVPAIILFHDLGYGDDLYRSLRPVLEKEKIPFVSSHQIFDANDPRSFAADKHDLPENDRRIALALKEIIHHSLN